MKKLIYLLFTLFLVSCTSNTILEPPKDLIPKDTMSLLVQEMMIASSAQFIKNKNLQKDINYMPFVYERFKVDSIRFQKSNLYHMSNIDDYIKIFDEAKSILEAKKKILVDYKKLKDSIRIDSLKKIEISNKKKFDSLNPTKKLETKKKKFSIPKSSVDLDKDN